MFANGEVVATRLTNNAMHTNRTKVSRYDVELICGE
jgi:hypothetical protein